MGSALNASPRRAAYVGREFLIESSLRPPVVRIAAAVAGLAVSAAIACDLSPIVINSPPAPDFLSGLPGAGVEQIRYDFDAPRTISESGRTREISNFHETIRVNLAGTFSNIAASARPTLPNDSCSVIVDRFGITGYQPTADGLNVALGGYARFRKCVIYDYPCFRGLEWYTCRAVNSVELGHADLSGILAVHRTISADRHRVSFSTDPAKIHAQAKLEWWIEAIATVLTSGLSKAFDLSSLLSIDYQIAADALIGKKLPVLEPFFPVDQEYKRLQIDDASFTNAPAFVLSRSLPEPRASSIICKLRSLGRQEAAYAESVNNPVTEHTVSTGDSLWKVADRVYGDGRYYVVVQRANNFTNRTADALQPGAVLTLPKMTDLLSSAGELHLVQGRQSLWTIAEARLGDGAKYSQLIDLDAAADGRSIIFPLDRVTPLNASKSPAQR